MRCPFVIKMNDYEYEIQGAPVVSTNRAPEVYNPLIRPKICFVKPVVALVAFICMNVLLGFVAAYCRGFFGSDALYIICTVLLFLLFNGIFFSLTAKRACIWLVHVYQHYAPDEVRLKCVFEPSCSEYMIKSIEKYGLFRGVYRGIKRLLRCHPPNGGKDEP